MVALMVDLRVVLMVVLMVEWGFESHLPHFLQSAAIHAVRRTLAARFSHPFTQPLQRWQPQLFHSSW